MLKQRPYLIETLTAIGLIAAPFVLPHLGFAPNTVNRILVWGLFGLGFDILFGFTGLLSFGQSAFYGTGGFVAAYLLTRTGFSSVLGALVIGMIAAAATGYLIGLIALRRTGIYFAMITVAIAEVFYFVEFNPLSDFTGGENGLPGVPTPSFNLGFTTLHFTNGWSLYQFIALCYLIGVVIALRIVRSPVGAIFSAIRDNPLRATAVGHNIHGYKLTAFVIAAAYAGFAGGLLGVLQAFMPPDAFTFETSGQLVMQTAIGGRGTLFGPLVGAAVWLFLQDFLQAAMGLGAAWKLVLGVVFVLLVCFLRGGIIGGLIDLVGWLRGKRSKALAEDVPSVPAVEIGQEATEPEKKSGLVPITAGSVRHDDERMGPILVARGLTKRYGGLVANSDIDFSVNHGELRGIIGPNGAGKSTFFKMITGQEKPDSGEVEIGQTVKLAYVDQSRDALAADKTVFDEVAEGRDILTVGRYETPSRAYLGRFNFKGQDQQKLVGNLSGGERGRLHLAKTLIAGGNVLLLDEPSNDLDVETLRALEDALLEFAGCVLVISHDRWFLDRIATHILAFEGDSQVTFFPGNYQEYEADKKKRLGEEGAKPKRIRYKPISR